jgi:hypothetical protein
LDRSNDRVKLGSRTKGGQGLGQVLSDRAAFHDEAIGDLAAVQAQREQLERSTRVAWDALAACLLVPSRPFAHHTCQPHRIYAPLAASSSAILQSLLKASLRA